MADFQLDFKAHSSPLSDILPQSPKGAACLGDSFAGLGIFVGVEESVLPS